MGRSLPKGAAALYNPTTLDGLKYPSINVSIHVTRYPSIPVKESGIENKVKHRYLIIPGKAARLSGEIEELTGWKALVGPMDSSRIPGFLKEKWPPKEEE